VLRRDTATENVRYYISGNFVEGRPELTANNNDMFEPLEYKGKKLFTIVKTPYQTAPVRTQSPQEAYQAVLDNVGAHRAGAGRRGRPHYRGRAPAHG